MEIELIENQKCNVYLTLFADPDNPVDATQFEVYGAAQNHSKNEVFTVEPTGADGQFKVVIPGLYVHKCCPWRYQIFVRNKETGNEWLATYGKIKVNDRYATVTSDKIALPEYECQYVLSNGNLVYTEQYSGVEIPSVNYDGIVNTISEHTGNSDIHVTAEEKQAWNAAGGGMKAIQTRMCASEETYINEDGYPLAKYGEVYIPESAPTGWYCVGTNLPDVAFNWVEHKQGERTLVWRPLIEQLSTIMYAPLEAIMTVPGWYTAEAPMVCV